MATRKFLYTDANGDYLESAGAFESADHITTSAGAGDSGKPVVLNGSGKIDSTMINADFIKRYLLADYRSTAALAASTYANGTLGVGATLTADANGAFAAQDGETPTQGDRYLIMDQAAGLQNGLYELTQVGDGSNPFILTRTTDYDETAEIEDGTMIAVGGGTAHADTQWLQTTDVVTVGTEALAFVAVVPSNIDDGAGLSFSGSTLNVNAGDGIQIIVDDVAVQVSDFAGTGLQDDGGNDLEIDFADTGSEMGTSRAVAASDLSANGTDQGAKILGGDPTSIAQSSATTIQGILEDLSSAITAGGEQFTDFTVGTGGVTAGDVVYINANDTVIPLDITDSAAFKSVGMAKTTESAAATVSVLADHEVLVGVLSGATAGDRYWWDGSALTTTQPTAAGSYVWQAGYAKNATDLFIDVDFVKKNI